MAQHTTRVYLEPSMKRFAEHLRSDPGASHVLLFSSGARGTSAPDSDYDIICLSTQEFELAQGRISLVSSVLPQAIDLLAA